MDILLVLADKEARKLIAFALESKFGAAVEQTDSTAKAMEHLLDPDRFDLVVCEEAQDRQKVLEYLLNAPQRISIILLQKGESGEVPSTLGIAPLAVVSLRDGADGLLNRLSELVESGALPTSMDEPRDYCRIQTELLTKVFPLEADIYIQLSQVKFLKIFRKGDTFTADDLTRYLGQKNIKYFFLKKADTLVFLACFRHALNEMFKHGPLPKEKALDLAESIQEAVVELSRKLGFTPEVQQLVADNVKLTIKALYADLKADQIFNRLTKNKESYISSHSVTLANLACLLATKVQWHSETTFEKFSYAAFLHDLPIENEDLASIQTQAELKAREMNFTKEEIQGYLAHPLNAGQMARKFPDMPSDVEIILAQHHERPDGSGFPKGLDAKQISPFACVFIVAHELLCDQIKKVPLPETLSRLKEKFSAGNFKKITQALTIQSMAE